MTSAPFSAAVGNTPKILWSQEAEQSVLGGLLLDNDSLDRIEGRLTPNDFFHKSHSIIFRAILRCHSNGSPFDIITIAEFLENHKRTGKEGDAADNLLAEIGGMEYLSILVNGLPSVANIRAYADIVRNYSAMRQLASASNKTLESLYFPEGKSFEELLGEAEQRILAIRQDATKSYDGFAASSELLKDAIDVIDKRFMADTLITGIPTGWTRFDNMTCGLQPQDLIIVAGRPAMGKTTFAMNIAERIAVRSERVAGIFSLEMAKQQLIVKILASVGRIDHTRLRTGKLEDDDWARLTSAVTQLDKKPLMINDRSMMRPSEIAALSRALMRERGELGCIVIDYLQLMIADEKNERRKDLEVGQITASLKRMAKELNTPVILLSQLSRSVEQRKDKRPVLSDLRESGSIEQDADVVIFIYRDEYYTPSSPDAGCAEIIFAKQRNGETGTLPFRFLGQFQRFEELDTPFMPSWASPAQSSRQDKFTDDVRD